MTISITGQSFANSTQESAKLQTCVYFVGGNVWEDQQSFLAFPAALHTFAQSRTWLVQQNTRKSFSETVLEENPVISFIPTN